MLSWVWVPYEIKPLRAMVSSKSHSHHQMRMYQTPNRENPQRWWWQGARNLCGKLIYLRIWLPNLESAPSTATSSRSLVLASAMRSDQRHLLSLITIQKPLGFLSSHWTMSQEWSQLVNHTQRQHFLTGLTDISMTIRCLFRHCCQGPFLSSNSCHYCGSQ